MSLGPAQRRQCIIAWLTMASVILAVAAASILPWTFKLLELERSMTKSQDQIVRYRRMVNTLPAVQAALAREQENDELAELSINASTPALAGAQLQRDLQEFVRASEARPISAQVLPVNASDQPPRVRVRIQLQGDTEQLLQLLLKLEQARPLFFVEQMSIRSAAVPAGTAASRSLARRRGARRGQSGQAGDLTVRLDVYGYSVTTPG